MGPSSECTSAPFASSPPIDSIIIFRGPDHDTHTRCEQSTPRSLRILFAHFHARVDRSSTLELLEARIIFNSTKTCRVARLRRASAQRSIHWC